MVVLKKLLKPLVVMLVLCLSSELWAFDSTYFLIKKESEVHIYRCLEDNSCIAISKISRNKLCNLERKKMAINVIKNYVIQGVTLCLIDVNPVVGSLVTAKSLYDLSQTVQSFSTIKSAYKPKGKCPFSQFVENDFYKVNHKFFFSRNDANDFFWYPLFKETFDIVPSRKHLAGFPCYKLKGEESKESIKLVRCLTLSKKKSVTNEDIFSR